MFTIRKATMDDIPLINKMAQVVFPDTYSEILSPEQLDYMMEWMYAPASLRKQMSEEGHIYYIAYKEDEPAGYVSIQPEGEHVFHLQKIYVLPRFQGCRLGKSLFDQAIGAIKEIHPTLRDAPECEQEQQGTAVLRTHGNEKDRRGGFPDRERILYERLYYGDGDLTPHPPYFDLRLMPRMTALSSALTR